MSGGRAGGSSGVGFDASVGAVVGGVSMGTTIGVGAGVDVGYGAASVLKSSSGSITLALVGDCWRLRVAPSSGGAVVL